MTRKFEEKVKYYGKVDTRKYRYVYHACPSYAYIARLPIIELDTTYALGLDNWEIVKTY